MTEMKTIFVEIWEVVLYTFSLVGSCFIFLLCSQESRSLGQSHPQGQRLVLEGLIQSTTPEAQNLPCSISNSIPSLKQFG